MYNGNISQINWVTASVMSNQNPVSSQYNFEYDALNRITSAIDNTPNQNYSLNNVDYDKNGNILALSRNGHLNVDATNFGLMGSIHKTV